MKKKISILGSTGSIGVNALKVVSQLKHEIDVSYLSANRNSTLLLDQIKMFNPKAVCIVDEMEFEIVRKESKSLDVEVLYGREGLIALSKMNDVDIMLNGLVGAAGMEPTLCAIQSGVDVALSNKESLVMAGNIIMESKKKSGAKIFPVDSEHSAIWQCMIGEKDEDIKRIILTGSGGPFRKRPITTFNQITLEDALKHPNWSMGRKITIDSATMMNKGLEVIEAYWLFGFDAKKIDIVIHPQSIIHSMIEMNDGSVKAQMGVPDMKLPIQFALTYPRHINLCWETLDFFKCKDLTFRKLNHNRFPSITLAYKALDRLGSAPAALNLANDISVYLFLRQKINFTDIQRINASVLKNHPWVENPNLEDLQQLDMWVQEYVKHF